MANDLQYCLPALTISFKRATAPQDPFRGSKLLIPMLHCEPPAGCQLLCRKLGSRVIKNCSLVPKALSLMRTDKMTGIK